MTGVLLQTTDEGLRNASSGVVNSFGDASGLMPAVFVTCVILFAVLGSARVYRWALNASNVFTASLAYAAKGVVTAVFLAATLGPLYYLSTLDSQVQWLALKALGGLIVAYALLVLLGALGEAGWTLLNNRHEDVTGHTLSDKLSTEDD
jgi:hypothetical protein